MPNLTAHDVAKYILASVDPEVGDLISNLKLQKLCYYAQGFSLALLGRPLFDDPIAAWQHGPVVPAVYHAYKEFGANAIPAPADIDFSRFSQDERDLLDEVYSTYGQFSAWKLRNMTHEEPPWRETDENCVIPLKKMKQYFLTQVEDAEED